MKGFHFDSQAADRAEAFFPHFLCHTKGVWAGKPFILLPWQSQIVRRVFGWKRPDGTRKYRTVYIEIPKKNGKSTFAAGIALYLLFADGEPGAEVYSAAGDRYQAGIVYETAREMVKTSPELNKRCESMRKSIFVNSTFSRYEALSREAGTKHGINAHGLIFDELHVQKTRELWDTLTEADCTRTQPLTLAITTAGHDRTSICREIHDYAIKVRDKIIEDDEFLPVLFAANEKDDWKDPRVWSKANPSLGVIVTEDYIRRRCEKAERIPGYQNTFKRLRLNIWTEQADLWIDLDDWDKCANGVSLEILAGHPCFAGLDLSSTRDLTALTFLFPPETENDEWKLIPRFYMPAENLMRRVDESKVPYDQWVQEGFIIPTPGNVVDYEYIRKDLEKLGIQISIKELALDRWNSTYLMTQLMEDGLDVVPFGQGFASMSAPSKEWEKLVISHKLAHDGNPVMRWMMSNVAVKEDPAGNIKPDKSRSSEKIDGVVAGIMALGRAIFDEGETTSVYEQKGQLML